MLFLQTPQSQILACISIVTLAISTYVYATHEGVAIAFVSFAFGILTMLITLFDQDCVVIGGCHIWGWIKMLMFAFALIVSTAVTVYVARVMKKEKDTTAESA